MSWKEGCDVSMISTRLKEDTNKNDYGKYSQLLSNLILNRAILMNWKVGCDVPMRLNEDEKK